MKNVIGLLIMSGLLLMGCGQGSLGRDSQNSPSNSVVSLGPVLLDSHLSFSGYGGKRIYGGYQAAQVFVPSSDWEVQRVRLKLWVDGTVPEFQVSLVEFGDGIPGSELSSLTVSTATLVVRDPGAMVEVPLVTRLVGGRTYAIVVSTVGGNDFNAIRWVYDTGGTGGYYYKNSGDLEWYQMEDRDFIFEVWGTE